MGSIAETAGDDAGATAQEEDSEEKDSEEQDEY